MPNQDVSLQTGLNITTESLNRTSRCSRPMQMQFRATLPPAWPTTISSQARATSDPFQLLTSNLIPLGLSKLTRRDVRARFSSLDTNRKLSTSPSSVPTAAQGTGGIPQRSWTSYHATKPRACSPPAGYIRLREQDSGKILPGGKILLDSQLILLLLPSGWEKSMSLEKDFIIRLHTQTLRARSPSPYLPL